MNENIIKRNWNVAQGKLKQNYGRLTNNDLIYLDGKEDEEVGEIQKKAALNHRQTGNRRRTLPADGLNQITVRQQRAARFKRGMAPGKDGARCLDYLAGTPCPALPDSNHARAN